MTPPLNGPGCPACHLARDGKTSRGQVFVGKEPMMVCAVDRRMQPAFSRSWAVKATPLAASDGREESDNVPLLQLSFEPIQPSDVPAVH